MLKTVLMGCLLMTSVVSQGPLETAAFDLRNGVSESLSVRVPATFPLLQAYGSERSVGDVGASVQLDTVVDMIRQTIAPSSWDEMPEVSISVEGGSLRVRHRREVVAQIRSLLASLHPYLMGRVRVELWRVSGDQVTEGGVLSPAAVTSLLSKGARFSAALDVSLNGYGRITGGQLVPFVADFDVEVAQKAQIADPVVRVVRDGADFLLRAAPAGGDAVYLMVSGSEGTLDVSRKVDSGSTWVGRLHLPSADISSVVASGKVPLDGGIVMGGVRGSEDEFYLMRVRRDESAPDPIAVPGLSWLPCGVAQLKDLPTQKLPLVALRGDDDEGMMDLSEDCDDQGIVQSYQVIEHLQIEMGEGLDPVSVGSWLAIRGTGERAQQAVGSLVGFADSLTANVGLEFRAGMVEAGVAADLASGKKSAAEIAGVLSARAQVATLSGLKFQCVAGREMAYLADHEVEIAQSATIADPQVGVLFSGLAVSGVVSRPADERISVRGEFVLQDLVGDIDTVDTNTSDVGEVEAPRLATSRCALEKTLESGRWTLVHAAPQKGGCLVVLVRARF